MRKVLLEKENLRIAEISGLEGILVITDKKNEAGKWETIFVADKRGEK